MSAMCFLINIFLQVACHPHLLLLLSRKHEVCSRSYMQSPQKSISSKKAEERSPARERNSFLMVLVFRKVHWADIGTMVNVVVCVLLLTMHSFFKKRKLKFSFIFCSFLFISHMSLIKHNIAQYHSRGKTPVSLLLALALLQLCCLSK